MDFDSPLKSLPEFYDLHAKVLGQALLSLKPVFDVKYLPVSMLRKDNPYNIAAKPTQMLKPPEIAEISVDLLSVSHIIRWISFGYLLIPSELTNAEAMDMLTRALGDGYMVQLFRNQNVQIFKAYEIVFTTAPGKKVGKSKKALLEKADYVHVEAYAAHNNYALFLRHSLKQLSLLIADEPGLLGPKLGTVLAALQAARDEVLWLFRHRDADVLKGKGKSKAELDQRHLGELLFFMAELRDLVTEYGDLVKRYYKEYLTESDSHDLKTLISSQHFEAYEQLLLSSFFDFMDDHLHTKPDVNLRGMKLDCRRLLVAMSVVSAKHSVMGEQNHKLGHLVNAIHYHADVYDNLAGVLDRFGGLGDLWFYKDAFINVFDATVAGDSQNRYLAAFASTSSTFPDAAHDAVPHEVLDIGRGSGDIANHVLSKTAGKAVEFVRMIAQEFDVLNAQTLPAEAVRSLEVKLGKKSKENAELPPLPGTESEGQGEKRIRSLRAMYCALADVCWGLNHKSKISVFNYEMRPSEYLTKLLEQSFEQTLVTMLAGPVANVPNRPSVVLDQVQAYMGVLRHVESYIDIDCISLFSNGLHQQTLVLTAGRRTHATAFVRHYVDMLVKKVPDGNIIVSTSRKALCNLQPGAEYNAAEYTDIGELQALCALIGPFGMKQLNDFLMEAVSAEMTDIKRIVVGNKKELNAIKTKTNITEICDNGLARLRELDTFTEKCKAVGVILVFRQMLCEQMRAVLRSKIPFMYEMVSDWHTYMASGKELDALAFSTGITSDVDPFLMQTLQPLCLDKEADFDTWNLMMVMCGASLRSLASDPRTVFNPNYDAHENNAQVLGAMINQVSAAVFTITSPNPQTSFETVITAQTEFLRVASILLLRLGSEKGVETKKHSAVNGIDAVYVIMDKLVKESPFVTEDVLEAHFPYSLIRTSLHEVYKEVK